MGIKAELRAAYTEKVREQRKDEYSPLIFIDKGEQVKAIFHAAFLGRTDFINSKSFRQNSLSETTPFTDEVTDRFDDLYRRYYDILERKDSKVFQENIEYFMLKSPVSEWEANPLQIAARMGHIDFVNRLLEKDAPLLIKRNSKGPGLLHCAVRSGNKDIVLTLLSAAGKRLGKDYIDFINHGDGIGKGERVYHVKRYYNEEFDEIRDYEDLLGLSPLETAIVLGETEIAKILINAGADVNTHRFVSPLRLAVVKNYYELAKLILDKMDFPKERIIQPPIFGPSELDKRLKKLKSLYADRMDDPRHIDELKKIQDSCVKPERKYIEGSDNIPEGTCGETPLITLLGEAMLNKNEDMALLLLERGAVYKGECMVSASALMVAVKYECSRVLKALINRGASVNVSFFCDDELRKHVYSVRDAEADQIALNLSDPYYPIPPLTYAILNDSNKCAELLIDNGVDLRKSSQAKIPLETAVSKGNHYLLTKMLDKDITLLSDPHGDKGKTIYHSLLSIIEKNICAIKKEYNQSEQELEAGNIPMQTQGRENRVNDKKESPKKQKGQTLEGAAKKKKAALLKWNKMRDTIVAAKKALDKKNSDQV